MVSLARQDLQADTAPRQVVDEIDQVAQIAAKARYPSDLIDEVWRSKSPVVAAAAWIRPRGRCFASIKARSNETLL